MKIDRKGASAASTQRVCVGPIASHIGSFAGFFSRRSRGLRADHGKEQIFAGSGSSATGSSVAECRSYNWTRGSSSGFTPITVTLLRRGDRSTGPQLLKLLRGLGVVPALRQKTDRTVLGQLTRDYERFLSSPRGLAPATLSSYLPIVRRFLTERFGDKALRLEDLRPRDLVVLFCVKFRGAVVPTPSSRSQRCARF